MRPGGLHPPAWTCNTTPRVQLECQYGICSPKPYMVFGTWFHSGSLIEPSGLERNLAVHVGNSHILRSARRRIPSVDLAWCSRGYLTIASMKGSILYSLCSSVMISDTWSTRRTVSFKCHPYGCCGLLYVTSTLWDWLCTPHRLLSKPMGCFCCFLWVPYVIRAKKFEHLLSWWSENRD